MGRTIASQLLGLMSAACLLVGSAPVGLATVVFDDHFTGNSGGVPAGWQGEGTIIETGTTATLYADAAMGTVATVGPNAGTVTISVQIAGTDLKAMVGVLDTEDWSNRFFVKIYAADGQLEVKASSAGHGEELYVAGYVVGYAGGPVLLTLVLEPTAFSVSTDSPIFHSGPIAYADVFTSFTRSNLGSLARLVTDIQLEGHPSAFASYDRITVDIAPPVLAQSLSFGQVKALYGQ